MIHLSDILFSLIKKNKLKKYVIYTCDFYKFSKFKIGISHSDMPLLEL